MTRSKPTIFVGSSSERLKIVNAVCANLRRDATVLRWDKNVFRPGRFTVEDLERAMQESDFAVFVLAGEDIVKWRRKVSPAPRDNVVLEIGLALGLVGRHRVLLLYSQRDRAKLPSDLLGFTCVPFEDNGPLAQAVKQACEVIRQQLIGEGLRELATDLDKLVTYNQRTKFSTDFAAKTVRTFDTFSGDLSWLKRDFATYRALAARGVRLRFLTDTPQAPIIRQAKCLGMSFRLYPPGSDARIKASVSDADVQTDARALVVQKSRLDLHEGGKGRPYDYRMKIYHGPKEYLVINALSGYFADLFRRGKTL